MMSLENRVVIITGANGATGRLAAQMFAEAGARLALVSRSAEHVQGTADGLHIPAERLLVQAADLRDPQTARRLAQAVNARFERADILLHLVGGWTGGKTVAEFDSSETEEMLAQHLWTTWHMAQAFTPLMAENGWGRIIAISSPLARHPTPKSAPYAIAKSAQETLLMTLAQELRGSGVTANVLQVRTIDVQQERESQPTKQNASWTTPEEIVAAVLYLCSDQAQAVTGARLPLFGGA
jgi:NAD(P)-dependent dehydrogenase (short-subunit alcohol dehydrogenase family)